MVRSIDRSTWREHVEDGAAGTSAGMPIPVSRTDTATCPSRRSAVSQIRPPALGVLGTVGEQVAEHLRQPGQVGVEEDRARRAARRSARARPRRSPGRAVSTALLTTSARGTRARRSSILLRLMRETSSRSSISRTMCASCRSIIPGPGRPLRHRPVRQPQHLQAVADRGQRVPEFVGQQGDEVVLLPVGLPQLLLHPLAARSRRGWCRPPPRPPRRPEHGNEDVVVDAAPARPVERHLAPDRLPSSPAPARSPRRASRRATARTPARGRKAFLMELDPLYCDVIVQRYEQVTGKKAELAG